MVMLGGADGNRTAARQAAVLFAVSGLMALVDLALPFGAGAWIGAVAAADLAIAVLCWVLPWQRWSSWALVPIAVAALVVIVVSGMLAGEPQPGYGLFFIVLFVWVGLHLARGASLVLATLALPGYAVPMLGDVPAAEAWTGGLIAVVVYLLVGETLAWTVTRLRTAETAARERAQLLGALAHESARIAAVDGASVLAETGGSLRRLGFDDVAVLVPAAREGPAAPAAPADPADPADPAGSGWRPAAGGAVPGWLAPAWVAAAADAGEQQWHAVGTGATAGIAVVAPVGADGERPRAVLACRRSGAARPATSDLEVTRILARQAAVALARFEQVHSARSQARRYHVEAVTDVLTGVGNRRAAELALEVAEPGDVLVMLDLDHFKRVNDELGHQTGDRVLSALGRHLSDHVRPGDVVARFGGEEFLLLLRGLGVSVAVERVERILRSWNAARPVTTFSAGVADLRPEEDVATALRRADEALYRAKQAGRDRVVVAPRSEGHERAG